MGIINTNVQTNRNDQLSIQSNPKSLESALPIIKASDAEVVKKVANTEIKPPSVALYSEPSRVLLQGLQSKFKPLLKRWVEI